MAEHLSPLRFAAFPAFLIFALWAYAQGGAWAWVPGLVLFTAVVLVDGWSAEDRPRLSSPNPRLLELSVWTAVLLTPVLTVLLLTYTASAGTPFAEVRVALRGADGPLAILGAVAGVGLIFGLGTSASHELFHRTAALPWNAAQVALAQYFYAPLAIEHVQGHHRNVGLPHDITTAPRGMGFWRHLLRAATGTYRNAARLEAERLRAAGLPVLSPRNRTLRGFALQGALALLLLWAGGIGALLGALAAGVIAIVTVETSQYVSHYGIVRLPGRPFEDRHAWNGIRTLSSGLTFNLQRHSAHHRHAAHPFWTLAVSDESPVYPLGIGMMSFLALFPPVFRRLTEPLVEDWEQRLASDEERALLRARPRAAGAIAGSLA